MCHIVPMHIILVSMYVILTVSGDHKFLEKNKDNSQLNKSLLYLYQPF